MLNTLAGIKVKMGQEFVENSRVPVTVVKAGPCVVTQILTEEKNGYWGVQLGLGAKKLTRLNKPTQGHLKGAIGKAKQAPSFLFEVRLSEKPEMKIGDTFGVSDIFSVGDTVAVTGVSKGKGFAGVMRRWNFGGGPRTHGQSDRERAPGSIGQGTTPGRVRKGKKMGGRMGGDRVHVSNLKVIAVDGEAGEVKIGGPVPGAFGSRLIVERTEKGTKDEQ